MTNFTTNPILIVIILTLLEITAISLGILVFYLILKLEKRGKNLTENTSVSKGFQQNLEKLIVRETQKNISETKQRIQQAIDYFIEIWRKQFEEISREIQSKSSEALRELVNESKTRVTNLDQEIQKEISELNKISSDAQDLLLQGTKEVTNKLSQDLSKEIFQAYKSVEGNLNQQIVDMKKEVENYKEEKLRDVDEKIYQILGKVAKKTMGKTVDLSTHEELVMEVLEKAKKEEFFK